MRDDGRRSSNVEDRRGSGGGGRGVAIGGAGTVVLIVLGLALGVDPAVLLRVALNSNQSPPAQSSSPRSPDEDKLAEFVSFVLADTEETWGKLFKARGQRYPEPKLVLFTGSVSSACGFQTAAVGPFYCPADQKMYIDLQFYQDLRDRFGAPGDFAQAYVIAHEVGHHIQTVTGVSSRAHAAKKGRSSAEANAISVRQELQADCYAGIWAHHSSKSRDILEEGDIEEGLRAAAAIGDDTLQRASGRQVRPESFTHGTSAQRVRWFKVGLKDGSIGKCDTFSAKAI